MVFFLFAGSREKETNDDSISKTQNEWRWIWWIKKANDGMVFWFRLYVKSEYIILWPSVLITLSAIKIHMTTFISVCKYSRCKKRKGENQRRASGGKANCFKY